MSGMPHFPPFFSPLAKLSEYKNGRFIGGREKKKPSYFPGATLLGFPAVAVKPPKERKKRGRPHAWRDCARLFELARQHPHKSFTFLLSLLWENQKSGGKENFIKHRRDRAPAGLRELIGKIQEIEIKNRILK